MDRTEKIGEKNEVICLVITFTPGVLVTKMSQMAHFLHFSHQLIQLYPLVFFISSFQDLFLGFLLQRKYALGTRLKIEWSLNDLFKILRPNVTFFPSYLLDNSGLSRYLWFLSRQFWLRKRYYQLLLFTSNFIWLLFVTSGSLFQ